MARKRKGGMVNEAHNHEEWLCDQGSANRTFDAICAQYEREVITGRS